MNKMSEDELKKYHHFKIKTSDGIELDLIETKYYEELLDLYQKEKDSNQWLLKAFDESRNNNIELAKDYYKLQKELDQEKEKNKNLIKQLQEQNTEIQDISKQLREKEQEDIKMRAKFVLSLDDYILKDKIRAKIKELEEKSDYWNCDEIEVLKELLKEN